MTEAKLKRGRPKKKEAVSRRPGQSEIISLRLEKKRYSNIDDLLSVDNPQELKEKYGIEIDFDLPWVPTKLRGMSTRAAAILETIARRYKKESHSK